MQFGLKLKIQMFDDSNSNNGYLLDFGGIEPSVNQFFGKKW